MDHLFYLAVIVCIVIEFIQIQDTKKCILLRKEIKDKKYKQLSSECQTYTYMSLFYTSVCLIGLLSSQWYGFVIILLISMIPKRDNVIVLKIDSFICLTVLLFIIINKYHLHLELI